MNKLLETIMRILKVYKKASTYDLIGFLDPETQEVITMSEYGVNNHGDLAIEMGYGGWSDALDEGYIRVSALNSFELPDLSNVNLDAVETCLLDFINTYPTYFKGPNAQYVYIDSAGGNVKSAKISDVLDMGLKDALTGSMTFAKKKKDSPLGYGIDELKEISQGGQEEIYRIDRYQAAVTSSYWVTPNNELINMGREFLHSEWADKTHGATTQELLLNGWIRVTDDSVSKGIIFQVQDLDRNSLHRVDELLSNNPQLQNYNPLSVGNHARYYELDMDDVLKFGAESALKRHQRETKMAEKRVEIPMLFLNKYFGHTLDTQAFNGIRDAVANVLEKNEHYFLDLGAEPREIVQLESEIKMASTPGILDTALEKLYSFGDKYGVEFKSDMQKGSAVTPSRVFYKLLQAWRTASSPTWVPKIDRALENVSIEFNDGTRMAIFDDKSVDTFLSKEQITASKKKPNKVKKISYNDYKTNLIKYLFNKLGNYSVDSDDLEKLNECGYHMAAGILEERQVIFNKSVKSKDAFKEMPFNAFMKIVEDYNRSIGHSLYSDTDIIILKTSDNIPSQGTDSEKKADEELLLINSTVTALKNRGFDASAEDYIEWMSGSLTTNEGAERFDEVVIELLGGKIYQLFKKLNVLNAKLRFELKVGPSVCDGIDLSINPNFSEVPEVEECKIQPGEPPVVYVVNLESII